MARPYRCVYQSLSEVTGGRKDGRSNRRSGGHSGEYNVGKVVDEKPVKWRT